MKMKQKQIKFWNKKEIILYFLLAFPATYISNILVLLTANKFMQNIIFLTFPIMFIIFAFVASPLFIRYLKASKKKLFSKYYADFKINKKTIILLTSLLNLALIFLFVRTRYIINHIYSGQYTSDTAWALNKTYLPLFILSYFILFYFIDTAQLYKTYKIKLKYILLNFFRILFLGIIFLFFSFIFGIFMEIILLFIGGGGVA